MDSLPSSLNHAYPGLFPSNKEENIKPKSDPHMNRYRALVQSEKERESKNSLSRSFSVDSDLKNLNDRENASSRESIHQSLSKRSVTSVSSSSSSSASTSTDIQALSKNLAVFNDHFQKKVETLCKPSKEEIHDENIWIWQKPENNALDLGRLVLIEEMEDAWKSLRHNMDKMMHVPKPKREKRILPEINLDNLGIETLIPWGKSSFKFLSNKYEKHLALAHQLLYSLTLEGEEKVLFEKKANIEKMKTSFPNQKLNFLSTASLVFSYITNLLLLGETLQHFSSLSLKNKPPYKKNSTLSYAKVFTKDLEKLKAVSQLTTLEKIKTIHLASQECGECIVQYAKELAKSLNLAPNTSDGQKTINYKNYLASASEEIIKSHLTIKSCETNFGPDFSRSIIAGYLVLSCDKSNISIPATNAFTCVENSPEYRKFSHDLLLFFTNNLGIDTKPGSPELMRFNPFDLLDEEESMDTVVRLFESEWKKELLIHFYKKIFGIDFNNLSHTKSLEHHKPLKMLKDKKSGKEAYHEFENQYTEKDLIATHPKMEGIFRLLPLLRAFNQTLLIGPHTNLIIALRSLTSQEANPITRALPTVYFEKDRTGNQKLDRETKALTIEFKDEVVNVIAKRLSVLDNTPPKSNIAFYGDCSVISTVHLTASIHDINTWTCQVSMEIERPKSRNSDLNFLQKYVELIALFETLGIPYSVKEI